MFIEIQTIHKFNLLFFLILLKMSDFKDRPIQIDDLVVVFLPNHASTIHGLEIYWSNGSLQKTSTNLFVRLFIISEVILVLV